MLSDPQNKNQQKNTMSHKEIRYSNYMLGGLSSAIVTIFTNPLEVVKIRLQLQGEMQKIDTSMKLYRGVFHGLYQIGRYDGIRALQKGLGPAIPFQFILNSVRLGIFDTATTLGWTKNRHGNMSFWLGFFWGGLGGSLGSCLGSPFFLVKTQMQSYADVKVAVGFQRKHNNMMSAFKKIFKVRGIRGLYRGVIGNIPRAALGSGSQLATFEPLKDYMRRHELNFFNATINSFVCSAIAGSAMAVAITPPDVILTRLYNQPLDDAGKGKYYNGVYDCLMKIVKTEGPLALYKGFWPSYLRIAPHSTLVLLIYDKSKNVRDKYFPL